MSTITADRFLLTTGDYRRMAEAGILGLENRVEFIHGQVVPASPIGAQHLFCVNALTRLFIEHIIEHTGDDVEVSVQHPVQLGPHHEPEPDLALFRAADAPRVPTAEDALLIIEAADTTYTYDRETKLPLYAKAGVSQVWVFNLPERRLEAYVRPESGAHADRTDYAAADRVPLRHTTHAAVLTNVLPQTSSDIHTLTHPHPNARRRCQRSRCHRSRCRPDPHPHPPRRLRAHPPEGRDGLRGDARHRGRTGAGCAGG